ncbi:MAG: T9SS type A sorting domain-containing protein, partial [Ferruginibacter sp.]
ELNLTIQSATDQSANILVQDMAGRILQRQNVILSTGTQWKPLDIHRLTAGMYYITVIINDQQLTKKFFKL